MSRRAWLLAGALALAGCAIAPTALPPAPAGVAKALAPTGELRVGVYPGSPTSLVRGRDGEARGVTVDLGRALGARLGVPVRFVEYPRVAEVVAAIARGEADFTVTNATSARARQVDFTPPLVALELGLLVPRTSALADVQAMDREGARIGVTQGSTSQGTLGARLTRAKLVALPTLDAAARALEAGELDGFATNKAILFELADRVPGARVLEGRWGLEHLAAAVPKGREAATAWLADFVKSAIDDGSVQRAAARAGLRGTAAAP